MAIHDPIIVARFWSKVAVRKSEKDCWLWTASKTNGYGHMKSKGEMLRSNRLAWEIFNDEPLGDRQALHKCDTRACCNPMHIYAGTPAQNSEDVHVRSRRGANKLSIDEVSDIRRRMNLGASVSEIAQSFGLSRSYVYKIRTGAVWKYDEASAFGRRPLRARAQRS